MVMSIFTRAKSIWRREKSKLFLYWSLIPVLFLSSSFFFFFVSFLIYFMWHTQMARTVYCGNLPNISLMTQNLLGTDGWGNYGCLSALVPSGNTPTLQTFKCNFPTHPRGSGGGGNK